MFAQTDYTVENASLWCPMSKRWAGDAVQDRLMKGAELARRKALLPHLDELARIELRTSDYLKSIKAIDLETTASGGDMTVPVWDEIQAREDSKPTLAESGELLPEEGNGANSTLARRQLLAEPTDADMLRNCAKELHQLHLQAAKEDEAKRLGLKLAKTPRSEVYSLCQQYPRFCELLRIKELGAALPAEFDDQRGPSWLVKVTEEVYDALTTAYGAGRPGTRQRFALPWATPRPPEVAAEYLWRRSGCLAPLISLRLIREINRASLSGSTDALMFQSFLSEHRDVESLAVVLYARGFLETVYSMSLRQVSQRAITRVNGRTGQRGTLPRKEELPLIVAHPTYSSEALQIASSSLFDPSVSSVLLPRAAVGRLARFLVGGRRGAEKAASDELGARAISTCRACDSSKGEPADGGANCATKNAAAPGALATMLVERLDTVFYESTNKTARLFSKATAAAKPAFPAIPDNGAKEHSEYAPFESLIQALADIIAQAPDDLIKFIKFDDDGKRFTMLEALQTTLDDGATVEELSVAVKDAEHDVERASTKLHRATARLARINQETVSEDLRTACMRAKKNTLLAEGELMCAKTLLTQRRSQLSALEHRIDLVWDTLQKASSTRNSDDGDKEGDTVSPPVRSRSSVC